MKFSKDRCMVLHLGCGNSHSQYKLGIKSIAVLKGLRGYWKVAGWAWAIIVPRNPTEYWAASKVLWPADWGRWSCWSALLCETSPGILYPNVESSVQEQHWPVGELATTDTEKVEVLSEFFASVLTDSQDSYVPEPHIPETVGGNWGSKLPCPLTAKMEWVWDWLMRLNVYKSIGLDDMHPRITGWCDCQAIEKSWLSGRVSMDWRKGNRSWKKSFWMTH